MNTLTDPVFSAFDTIRHGFTTRFHAANFPAGFMVKQVHGSNVMVVEPHTQTDVLKKQEADALITQEVGITISVQTADCLPALFYDPVKKTIGAAHAGWRGLSKGVLQETLFAMNKNFQSQSENIQVALGPHIAKCHFEVGEEVWQAFCANQPKHEPFFQVKSQGKWLADLAGLARAILQENGVIQISTSKACTFCDADLFYSYRREQGKTGRHFNFIELLSS